MPEKDPSETEGRTELSSVRLEGRTICPGVAIGRARILDRDREVPHRAIRPEEAAAEVRRYDEALTAVRSHLRDHIEQVHGEDWLDAEQILRAHEAILGDGGFHDSVRSHITGDLRSAAWALESEAERAIERFEASRSAYLAARAEDIRDLVASLLEVLVDDPSKRGRRTKGRDPKAARIHLSGHLYPSHAIDAKRRSAGAFVTESSASLSHAAILLKGFGIPSLGGVLGLRESVEDGDLVIVDATTGELIVRPDPPTVLRYERIMREAAATAAAAPTAPLLPPEPGRTRDGVSITLMGNIDNPAQISLVRQSRLEGVGLFRTEFLVLESGRIPSVQEQLDVYRRVVVGASGTRVVFRTFDIGADKQVPGLSPCSGGNPALGIRGIRRHLRRSPDELRQQLRAILRAGAGHPVGIMIPMVTTVDEVREVKVHLEGVRTSLRDEGLESSGDVRFGAMIEVPAAAYAAREILREVDFLSIGSNDLLQYFMASDRDNESTIGYLDAENEGFLRLLGDVAAAAREANRESDLSICGEIASRPEIVPRLVRLGYRSLSVSPIAADAVRDAIGEARARPAREGAGTSVDEAL